MEVFAIKANIPCVTLRENTERPKTVEQGTNTVVGTDARKIVAVYEDVMAKGGRVPKLWGGKVAECIVGTINHWALESAR